MSVRDLRKPALTNNDVILVHPLVCPVLQTSDMKKLCMQILLFCKHVPQIAKFITFAEPGPSLI